ncbi:DUF4179 domain-containing protein [Paenibacillus albidus]|uniref:DUF4179 domain-containing protein n=1 Tax=Paenibacillus albidus TaxID=2041023 RepID=UPI001BEA0D30|nr:DUF4179 domain-containing protein [Paenibacillus albidus]MBT2287862.1 DUF4179 domain-containing protein [Paenibacillus albidus]
MRELRTQESVAHTELAAQLEHEAELLLKQKQPGLTFEALWEQHQGFRKDSKLRYRYRSPLRRWSLGVSVAAVTAAILTLGAGFVSPQVADALRKIPFFEYLYAKGGGYDKLRQIESHKLIHPVDIAALDQGIEVRMDEVYYDGIQLVLNYEVNYPASHPTITSDEATVYYDLDFDGISPQSIGTHDFTVTGDRSFAGTTRWNFTDKNMPDELLLKMKVDCIGTTRGNWELSIPLHKGKSKEMSHTIELHRKFTFKNSEYTLKKLMFGPVTTQILIGKDYPLNEFNLAVEDDQGTLLSRQGGDGGTATDLYFNLSALGDLNPRPRYVTLIFSEILNIPAGTLPVKDSHPLTGGYPFTLQGDQGGTITITTIEYEERQTVVYYEASQPLSQKTSFQFDDAEGQPIYPSQDPVRVSKDSLSFKVIFPALDENKVKSITTNPYSYPEDKEMLRMRVPLDWNSE